MSYDAGALLFKIQTVGAQLFKQDQADAEKAIEKTGRAAAAASTEVDKLGKSTDETAKKSKSSKAPLDEQGKATETLAHKTARLKKEQAEAARVTAEQAEAAKKLSAVLLVAGAAVSAMVTLSVVKYAEFDSAMSNVRAATMASVDDQKALGEAALEAGADTAYSASEAAAAEEELAKAGLTVAEIVGGSLNGALALAAAGQLDVARSAEIMATTLKQYNLEGKDASHVSDLLAAGAGKAQGSVDDLAQALQYVGPVAAGLGISVEETTGALALFASQGQIGERAGTGLRGVLMSLSSPSALAAKTMKEYNVEIFDSNGKMKSLAGVSDQLKNAFSGLTEEERSAALGRIFGNEQITAARVLYSGGAAAVNEWTDAVDDSGYAAEQAAIRQDNLAGDIEKLGGAFDTALIRTGSSANDVLRGMVQAVTEMVDMFGEAPQPVQTTALVLGVAAAAMLVFAGGAVGARTKFIELKATLDTVNGSMGKTALIGGAVGLALVGVIAIVGGLMAAHAAARQKAQSYADTLAEGTQKITAATREMVAANLTADQSFLWISQGSLADNAETLGLSVSTVTDAIEGNADAIEKVNKVIKSGIAEGSKPMKDANMEAYDAAVLLQSGIEGEIGALDEAEKVARQKADATDEGIEATKTSADAYLEEAGAIEDVNSQLSQLIDKINEANGVNQDAITANADYQQALADVKEQVDLIAAGTEGYAYGLDLSTQAGRDNMAMLQDLARDSQDAAQAQFDLDGNTEDYIARLGEGRQALIDSALAMGASQEEAEILAEKIYAIPSEKEISILADTVAAQEEIDRLIKNAMGREIRVKIIADGAGIQMGSKTITPDGFSNADGNVVRYFASGGVENHVAQMARAGDVRVWAEPETEGESYVPHAMSKRGRSDQIMVETARILGGTYIPGGGQSFASGAVIGADAPATPQTVRVILEANGRLFEYIDAKVQQPTKSLGSALRGAR